MDRRVYVAVIGPGAPTPDVYELARSLGEELARRDAIVVCGGLGGAKEAGGTTVGILPGLARSEGNDYLDVALPTGLGELRNGLIVRAADVVVAVHGEFGTLSEISFALKTGVPVVGIETWELVKGGREAGAVERVTGPQEAAERALARARAR
jgi:uncharacterized protein (TIGR00725 family)